MTRFIHIAEVVREVLFKTIISPISPLMTLLIGWMMSLLTTPYSSELPAAIQVLLQNKICVLVTLLFCLFFTMVYSYIQSEFEEKDLEIERLKTENDTQKKNLDVSAGIIMNKYGEFARFQRNDRFYEICQRFVNGNEEVESVQIYQYHSGYRKNDILYQLQYVTGYVQEATEINCILQGYYVLKSDLHRKVKNVIHLWKQLMDLKTELTYEQKLKLKEEFEHAIVPLFDGIIDGLNQIAGVEDVTEEHFSEYLVLLLLLRLMNDNSTITVNHATLQNQEVEEYLSCAKRTGIFASMLLKDSFIFIHNGKSLKNGRMYLCEYLKLEQGNYIITLSVQSRELTGSNQEEIIYNLHHYSQDLREMLTYLI